MIQEANNLEEGAIIEADVCIAGAGAAGITTALGLSGLGLRVVLLESGSIEFEEDTQALYEGDAVGIADVGLTVCRARQFGGTTQWWAGWCRPLAADIFEPRAWMERSGWPISREDLDPFYKRAHRTTQIGAFEYDAAAIAERLGRPLLELDPTLASNVIYQYSPPTNFSQAYLADLQGADDIEVILHANLTNIALSEMGQDVVAFECKTLMGKSFEVRAGRFVLALGGIETPRIMLASNQQESAGVGNSSDMVGRCFMEHPHFYRGAYLLLPDPPDMDLYLRRQNVDTSDDLDPEPRSARIVAALGMSAEARRAHQLMGFAATVRQVDFDEAQASTGPLASSVIGQLIQADAEAYGLYSLDIRAEQQPLPDSRVTLLEERDALGVPKLQLDWRIYDETIDSIKRTLQNIGAALGKAGLGRLWMPLDEEGRYKPRSYRGGCHHLGTTRMSDDPTLGVVDSDLKAHDLSNLYICSSAVFPTGGFANPTLTITALAHRLADHLGEET